MSVVGNTALARFYAGIKSLFIKDIAVSGKTITITKGDDTTSTITTQDTTYSNMTAASDSAAGKAGLVPAPPSGAQTKFLRGDATWANVPNPDLTPYALKTDIPTVWDGDGNLVSPAGWKIYVTN